MVSAAKNGRTNDQSAVSHTTMNDDETHYKDRLSATDSLFDDREGRTV